jgi:tetratricopeptide (TPR) repeat protein
MSIIDDLISNKSPETLLIDENSFALFDGKLPDLDNAFQKNSSTKRVILKTISPSACQQIVPILLKTGKPIQLENPSHNALRKIYSICDKYPENFQVTCADVEWNSKFAALNQAKKQPVSEQKFTLPPSLGNSTNERKSDAKQEINAKELRDKAFKLLETAKKLNDMGCQLRSLSEDTTEDREISKATSQDGLKYINMSFTLYDQVLETNIPDLQAEVFMLKGKCLSQMCRTDEAIKNFEHALKLNPTDFTVISYLALEYATHNQFKKALELLRQTEELFPNYKNRILVYRGRILAAAGELEAAAGELSTVTSQIVIRPLAKQDMPLSKNKFEMRVPNDLYVCGALYEACVLMSDIKNKLKNTDESKKFKSMSDVFKKKYISLGGELVPCRLTPANKVQDEKETPVLHHKTIVNSVDDISLRQGAQFKMWGKRAPTSREVNHVTQLTEYGKQMLRQGRFLTL